MLPHHAPVTGHARLARPEALNRAIAAGDVTRADDSPQSTPLREALLTRDRKTVYRVDDGIPVLLAEEAIATTQIGDFPDK